MAGEEVGVNMRLDDEFDAQTELVRVAQVVVDVAARVDEDGASGALIADQVRRLGQAVEVVLREVHGGLQSGCPRSASGRVRCADARMYVH